MYYLFIVQNKNFQIQNTIQYSLMAFLKTFWTKTNLLHSKNRIDMFKRAWLLEVQEALEIGIFYCMKVAAEVISHIRTLDCD